MWSIFQRRIRFNDLDTLTWMTTCKVYRFDRLPEPCDVIELFELQKGN